jgi:hypothetical protein
VNVDVEAVQGDYVLVAMQIVEEVRAHVVQRTQKKSDQLPSKLPAAHGCCVP